VILARLIALAALLLAGCSEAEQAAAPAPVEGPAARPAAPVETAVAAPTETPPANVPVNETAELVGEYRLAGVDGRDIDLAHGVTARIDDTGIIVESGCVVMSWVWFFEDGRLVTEQLFPRESCGRKLLPEEEAIAAAFNGATHVGRTPANGIEFAGENGAVLLFGQ
jgi:hypothetical protein